MPKTPKLSYEKKFKILYPYLYMIYKKDYDEKLKVHFLKLYHEKEKKKINYQVVDKIPGHFLKEALRYRFPRPEDLLVLLFLGLLVITLHVLSVPLKGYWLAGLLGGSGVLFGLLTGFIHSLAYNGPRIKSIVYLRDFKSKNQTVGNVLSTLFFWILAFVCLQSIWLGITDDFRYLSILLVPLPFMFIFYKGRMTP
ncbi:MAG: hypothetical protein JEY91_16580 [Spirochaetaceae bacterium]|nr:hypothetical protein [Spirochaetaceae bacterium]